MKLHKLIFLALIPALMCACASTSQATDNFRPSAEEMTRRFLKLISSLQSKDDINPEYIQRVLGVPMRPTEDDGRYAYKGQLSNGKKYSIIYSPGPVKENEFQDHWVFFSLDDRECIVPYLFVRDALIIKGQKLISINYPTGTSGRRSLVRFDGADADFFVEAGTSGKFFYDQDYDQDCAQEITVQAR
jgi:hypothetical protein